MEEKVSVRKSQDDELAAAWRVLGVVVLGSFMTILDATVVNVAIPSFEHQFDASTSQVQWIVSCYTLALGIATPLAGWLGTRFGEKRVYLVSIGGFTVASLLCGLAPTLPLMIAARIVQGLAGGFALPLGMAMLFSVFPPNRRGQALGVFSIVLVVAPALGPLLGGVFSDAGLQSWIFFVNVPIGLVAVLLGSRRLPGDVRAPARPRVRLPLIGVALTCVGFGGVLVGASLLGVPGTPAGLVVLAFALGVAALIALVLLERGREHPLLKVDLYRTPSYSLGTGINTLAQVVVFGVQFLIPLALQAAGGFSPLQAGFALLPLAVAGGITGLVAGRVTDRLGPRRPLLIGLTLMTVGIALISVDSSAPAFAVLIPAMLVTGAGIGTVPPIVQPAAMRGIGRPDMGSATSLLQATQRMSQALAVAVLATVVAGSDPSSGVSWAYGIVLCSAVACVALAVFLPNRPEEH